MCYIHTHITGEIVLCLLYITMINSSGKLYCNHKDGICRDCLIRWNNRTAYERLTGFNDDWVGNAKMVETANTKGQTNIARKLQITI
jgi:hypothetical protein